MTDTDAGTWSVHDEQDLGSFGRGSLQRVSVDLPDGTSFDQYVIHLPRAVVVAATNEADEVLMLRRHRFIVDRWVWELPGGYTEAGEDDQAAAAEYHQHRGIKETEAESVAYVVAGLLGLDTAATSISYVTGWTNGDTDTIKNTATRVLHAVRQLTDALISDGANHVAA